MTLDAETLPAPGSSLLNNASVFLDLDGTLLEIAPRPDAVRVDGRLHRLMGALSRRLDGRLAIVSGRSGEDVHALFGAPHFPIAGSHGAELRWPDGRITSMAARRDGEWDDFSALAQRYPGVLIERKPFGVALHYRLEPEAEQDCRRRAQEVALRRDLHLQTGKMVIELKPKAVDKGSAVAALWREPPMAGGIPIFVGDDDTDEAGFAMAAQLGGVGVLVGAPRNTNARYRLGGVAETLDWLERACGLTT